MVVVRAEEGTTDLAKVCMIGCVCNTYATSSVCMWGTGWSRLQDRIWIGVGFDR